MIEALIYGKWQRVDIVSMGRRGCTVVYKRQFYATPFSLIRWLSDDWYVTETKLVDVEVDG